jgi:hypothetical protein
LAHDAKNGDAPAIEDESSGDDFAELEFVECCWCGSGEDGKSNFLFLEEARNLGLGFGVIEGNGQECYILRREFLREFCEHRQFFAARAAPGGPKIEHDNFAAIVGEGMRVAGEIGKGKFGGRRCLRGSLRANHHRAQAQQCRQ